MKSFWMKSCIVPLLLGGLLTSCATNSPPQSPPPSPSTQTQKQAASDSQPQAEQVASTTQTQPKRASLSVYEEAENASSYLWQPSGEMPDGEGIELNPGFEENCHQGSTCIKTGFIADQQPKGWGGVYWLANDSWDGPGVNIYDEFGVTAQTPMKLTFWARGKTGGEKAQFKVGGVSNGDDSITLPAATAYLTLSTTWQQYEIDLTKKDLSNVVGGFCWVTDKAHNQGQDEVWLYLDDIRYELK